MKVPDYLLVIVRLTKAGNLGFVKLSKDLQSMIFEDTLNAKNMES